MKKALSFILASVLAMVLCLFPVSAAEPVALSATKTTTVEFEDFKNDFSTTLSLGSESFTDVATSGGDFLHTGWKGADVTLTLPITVSETNVFTIEYIGAYAGWLSNTLLYLDSQEADPILDCKADTASSVVLDGATYYFCTKDYPARKYTFSIELTAGEHTLYLVTPLRDASAGGGTASAWDCISFIPTVVPEAEEVTVSATEKTVIEYEDYASFVLTGDVPYNGASVTDNDITKTYASGGKVLNMSERTSLTDAVIHIPVYVEKEGLYDLNHFIINANKGQYLSLCSLKIDGTQVSINNNNYSELLAYPDADGKATYMGQYYPMARYFTQVSLTEGSHIISLEAAPITTLTNGAYGVKFYADCIELSPYREPVTEITGDTAAVIEAEDYVGSVYTTDNAPYAGATIDEHEKASGGKYFKITYGSIEEAFVDMKLNVTKAGWYDMDAIINGKGFHTYISEVHFTIDGEDVLSNMNIHLAEDLSEDKTFVNKDFLMQRFSNRIYLTEGEKVLQVYATKSVSDEKVKFFLDCIRFTPAKTTVTYTSNKVQINAAYDESVSGTAVAAFYKDNQLMHLASSDITEATQVFTIETETEIVPDYVKVFLWDSFVNVKPLAEAVTVTDIKVNTPSLYLLGDSVCAFYDSYSFWQQGWGTHIEPLFTSDLIVRNVAVGGRSTKTFRENHWDDVYAGVKYGDYVMINFGLNDIGSIASGKGTSLEDYEMYLNLYCDEIKAKGATPILISPMPECNTSHNALIARSGVMEKVAEEQGIVFLPLNNTLNYQWILDENGNYSETMSKATFDYYFLSESAFNRLEEEYGKEIPQEQWDYIATTPDRTHINIDGAQHVAQTIADLLAESDSPLKNYLK